MLNFSTFKERQERSMFLKIAAQTFEMEIFLIFSKSFRGFVAHFLIKVFVVIKTRVGN